MANTRDCLTKITLLLAAVFVILQGACAAEARRPSTGFTLTYR